MSIDTSFQIAFYNDLNIFDQKKIDAFVCRCYQETAVSSIHLPELNVLSVCMWNGNQMIGYAGIFLYPFSSTQSVFAAITCFCIKPDQRNLGYGIRLLTYLESYLHEAHIADFSLFTCHPQLTAFYTTHSNWRELPIRLTSGSRYDSRQMGLVVLFQSFCKHMDETRMLDYDGVDLDLPDGLFL